MRPASIYSHDVTFRGVEDHAPTQTPIAQGYVGHAAVGLGLLWTPPVCTEGNRLQTNGSWSVDPRGQVGR